MEPQQTNPTPVLPQSKLNHKIFYILILIFVAIIGSFTYLFYLNYSYNPMCIPDCGAIVVPIYDETLTWKTYRDEEYGFGFKYPSELEVVGGGTDKVWRVGNPQFRETVDWMKFSLELIFTKTKDLNKFANDYINNNKDYLGNSRKIIKTEQSNGELHIEFEPIYGDFAFSLKPKETGNYYFIISSSTPYAVKFETRNNYFNSSQFEQILSTFKFIDKTSVVNPDNLLKEISQNKVFAGWLSKNNVGFEFIELGHFSSTYLSLDLSGYKCSSFASLKSISSPDGRKTMCFGSGGEPDSYLYFNDNVAQKFVQLFSCGTPCNYENGFWLDSDNFVFLSSFNDYEYDNNMKPYKQLIISVYDFKNSTIWSWSTAHL